MAPRVKFPLLQDVEWLREQYVDRKRTTYDIAAEVGCSDSSVYMAMRKHGVEARPNTERVNEWKAKSCDRCGLAFQPTGPAAKFCSDRCRENRRYQCGICDTEFWMPLLDPPPWTYYSTVLCSEKCKDEARAKRQGGERQPYVTNGVRMIPVPVGTPGAVGSPSAPWMLEHRFVMQQAIGRPLLPTETVHHKNLDDLDNRLANLQLRQGRHGRGAVFQCRDCGSENVEAVDLAEPEPDAA